MTYNLPTGSKVRTASRKRYVVVYQSPRGNPFPVNYSAFVDVAERDARQAHYNGDGRVWIVDQTDQTVREV